ncbi:hypothetical protein IAT38_002585 [Cryptococcus sp. DSM 104549]
MPAQIPEDLWSHILGFCLEPRPDAADKESEKEYQAQETLARALRVNKTFYLAAAPHLYRRPLVAHPGSFFLGLDRAFSCPPPTPSAHSDFHYLSAGNSKLPLLRHVQHLTLLSRSSFPEATEYDSITFTTKSTSLAERILSRVLYPADELVCAYTAESPLPGILPLLRGVSFGCDISHHRTTRAPVQPLATASYERLASLLLRVGELPKAFCQSGMFSPFSPQCDDWPKTLPEVVTHHADHQTSPRIVFGTLNRVYADTGVGTDGRRRNQEPEGPGMITSIGYAAKLVMSMVENSRPQWSWENYRYGAMGEGEMDRQDEMVEGTILEVYGLEAHLDMKPVPANGDATDGGHRGDRSDLKQRTIAGQLKALRKVNKLVNKQLEYDWIKLLPEATAPKCAACGLKPLTEAACGSGGRWDSDSEYSGITSSDDDEWY